MTRIFDALRKARSAGSLPAAPPAPAPFTPSATRQRPPFGAPVALAAAGEAPSARPSLPPLPPPALALLTTLPPMSDDVLREMSTLRVHLEAALSERVSRKVILVSPQGGEGTTTVATQFAAALARDTSIRVLLVDAHGLRPTLSGNAAPAPPQSATYGMKPKPLAPATDPASSARLRVLPLPEEFRNPGGISGQALRQMLDSVEAGFDWIIVDGPPVLESPNAAALASVADGVAVVVQAGRTKRPVLSRSVDLLRKAGARVVGTILNRRRLEIPGFIYRRI